MHLKGFAGKPQSAALAMRYFEQAAERGHTGAQYKLGQHYRRKNHPPNAFKWAGDAVSQQRVSEYYAKGYGVIKNKHKARRYAQLAAAQGYKASQARSPR